jgi:hypothetical protein
LKCNSTLGKVCKNVGGRPTALFGMSQEIHQFLSTAHPIGYQNKELSQLETAQRKRENFSFFFFPFSPEFPV